MTEKRGVKGLARWLGGVILLLVLAGCQTREASHGVGSADMSPFSPERLAAVGKALVFGVDDPKLNAGGRLPIGKGQCPFCHAFSADQRFDRSPSLVGVEGRSRARVQEDRYRMFIERYAQLGEPDTGIRPHAQSGGEYLIESLYCPNCYVPAGFGVDGSRDLQSPMLVINRLPVGLTDYEIVAVVAYLQSKDTPGDFSKVTAKEDWERYFRRMLAAPAREGAGVAVKGASFQMALPGDTPAQIIYKMGCFVCHRVPGVSNAKIGLIGPLLVLKSSAPRRLQSPEYQVALREGRAHATTPREYVVESILHPDAFVVPGFSDDMAKDYDQKFTVEALDKLANFLLTLDEEAARSEGLDRLPQEKEGSLFKKPPSGALGRKSRKDPTLPSGRATRTRPQAGLS